MSRVILRGVVDCTKEEVSEQTLIGPLPTETLTNLSVFDGRPLEVLRVETEAEEGREKDDGLDTNLLSLVVLWLGGPVQEGNDVLRQL